MYSPVDEPVGEPFSQATVFVQASAWERRTRGQSRLLVDPDGSPSYGPLRHNASRFDRDGTVVVLAAVAACARPLTKPITLYA